MTSTTLALAYGTVITGAVCSARGAILANPHRFPRLTMSLGVVLAICLAAQIAVPPVLNITERNAAQIHAGEWHRLLTALFFQDGWLLGGSWNIAVLLLVGSLTEQMLEPWQWVVVYSASAIAAELVALRWQPIGAGNSVGVFGLCGALIIAAWRSSSRPFVRICAAVSCGAGALLVFERDIHGAAFGVGALAALLLGRTARSGDRLW